MRIMNNYYIKITQEEKEEILIALSNWKAIAMEKPVSFLKHHKNLINSIKKKLGV